MCYQTIVVVFLAFTLAAPTSADAQDPCGCNAALTKDLIVTESARSETEAFLNVIDARLFEEFKSSSSFLAKIPIVKGLIEAAANFEDFRQRRQSYFQQVNYSASVDESFRQIQMVTSPVAYPTWGACKLSCNLGPGLTAWKSYEDADTLVVTFRYVSAPGSSRAIDLSSSTISGGTVTGAPRGRLFPSGYRLQPSASDSVSIDRRQASTIIATVKGGGYVAPNVESRWGDTANTGSANVTLTRPSYTTTPLSPVCVWTRTESGREFSDDNNNEHCNGAAVCSGPWRATRLVATLGPEQNTIFSNPRKGQCIARIRIAAIQLEVPEHGACHHFETDELGVRDAGASARFSLRAASWPVKYEFCADRSARVPQSTTEAKPSFSIVQGRTFSFDVPVENQLTAVLNYSIGGSFGVLRPGDRLSNDGRLEIVGAPITTSTATYYQYRVSQPVGPSPAR